MLVNFRRLIIINWPTMVVYIGFTSEYSFRTAPGVFLLGFIFGSSAIMYIAHFTEQGRRLFGGKVPPPFDDTKLREKWTKAAAPANKPRKPGGGTKLNVQGKQEAVGGPKPKAEVKPVAPKRLNVEDPLESYQGTNEAKKGETLLSSTKKSSNFDSGAKSLHNMAAPLNLAVKYPLNSFSEFKQRTEKANKNHAEDADLLSLSSIDSVDTKETRKSRGSSTGNIIKIIAPTNTNVEVENRDKRQTRSSQTRNKEE